MPDAPAMPVDESKPAASVLPPRRLRVSIKGAARAIALTLVVALALLCFPSVVPWMVAGWLLWHTVLVACGQPGWVPLVACAAILLAKRVYWAPALIACVGVVSVVVLWRATRRERKPRSSPWANWLPTLCLWGVWIWLAIQWHISARCNHVVQMDPVRPIVCVGDSLTSGLLPDPGYPAELGKMLRLPVVNMGQSGISTEGGLNRLPRIKEHNPQVVVIELGGHDFLQGRSRAATKEKLQQMIAACREMGAEVVLVEIPRGFMTDPFAGLDRELAAEHDLELVPRFGHPPVSALEPDFTAWHVDTWFAPE